MNTLKFRSALVFALVCGAVVVSIAQNGRVRHGVKSGEITRKEAKAIRAEKQDVREARADAKADGVVTQEERQEIKQEKKQASRKIYRAKHNNRRRR
jgi:hypothetical protein